jgi:uncharacterized protein YggT (Ycf19 family)
MAGENQSGMQCAEFDALLNDALDQTLTGPKLESFQAHAHSCAVCGPLRKEVEAGQRWLKSLGEVEPPVHLVRNILIATSGLDTSRFNSVVPHGESWWDHFLEAVVAPAFGVMRQPRFAMSFGMVFFSLSISLNLAGVRLTDLRNVDLRPSAIKRSYYETSGRVVKYYENIRFVYEIESRVREFKRVTASPEARPEAKPKDRKNDTSGQPEPRQERNYSLGESQPVLAAAPHDPPVVTVNTYRRFS